MILPGPERHHHLEDQLWRSKLALLGPTPGALGKPHRQRDTDQHEGRADEHSAGKGLSENQGSDAHSDDWNPIGDEG